MSNKLLSAIKLATKTFVYLAIAVGLLIPMFTLHWSIGLLGVILDIAFLVFLGKYYDWG